jgi:hypothetical protein
VADFFVARHLDATPVVYPGGERLAHDAATAKYQQAVEKALKAFLLWFGRESFNPFGGHDVLGEPNLWNVPRLAAVLQKIFNKPSSKGLQPKLRMLSKLAPSGTMNAVVEDDVIVALPENTEYPFTDVQGNIVAPYEVFSTLRDAQVPDAAKTVAALFRAMKQVEPRFVGILP